MNFSLFPFGFMAPQRGDALLRCVHLPIPAVQNTLIQKEVWESRWITCGKSKQTETANAVGVAPPPPAHGPGHRPGVVQQQQGQGGLGDGRHPQRGGQRADAELLVPCWPGEGQAWWQAGEEIHRRFGIPQPPSPPGA